jgi:tetratricopeptide (TPR) repeat protein
MAQGDDDTAKDLYIEALECYKECCDDFGICMAYDHLTTASLRQQNLQAARDYALESLSMRRNMPNNRGTVAVLLTLAHIEELRGFAPEAKFYKNDALRYTAEYEWLLNLCAPVTAL